MLKKTTLSKIAALLKLDPAAFETAARATDEQDVAIDEKLQVYTDTDLTSRDRNKYNEGKKAGEEMLVKALKTKHSIDITGDDIDPVIEAITAKIKKEANTAPDAKVTDLEGKVAHWKKQHDDVVLKVTEAEKRAATVALDNELLTHFPKTRLSTLTDKQYLLLLKEDLNIIEKDGKRVVVKAGVEQVNKKDLEPLALGDVINELFNERKWSEANGGGGAAGAAGGAKGGGGGNSKPGGATGKFSKLSEINAHLQSQGIDPKGEKGAAFIQAATKENPQMDFQT